MMRPCPKCDVKNTWVIDTRFVVRSNATRRRLRCESCDHRFTTLEVLAPAEAGVPYSAVSSFERATMKKVANVLSDMAKKLRKDGQL